MITDPNFKESCCLYEKSENPSSTGFVNVLPSLVLFQFTFRVFLAFCIPSEVPGFCFPLDGPETCCLFLFFPTVGYQWKWKGWGLGGRETDQRFQQRCDWFCCCLFACLLFYEPNLE